MDELHTQHSAGQIMSPEQIKSISCTIYYCHGWPAVNQDVGELSCSPRAVSTSPLQQKSINIAKIGMLGRKGKIEVILRFLYSKSTDQLTADKQITRHFQNGDSLLQANIQTWLVYQVCLLAGLGIVFRKNMLL